jgi:hypothetical protein
VGNDPKGGTDDFGGLDIKSLREMAELKIRINNETNKVQTYFYIRGTLQIV